MPTEAADRHLQSQLEVTQMSQRGRASTRITIVVAALLVAGFFLIGRPPGGPAEPAACSANALVVTASNEKSGLLGEMAADFEKTRPTVDGQCIAIKVVRKASGEAEEALARGW